MKEAQEKIMEMIDEVGDVTAEWVAKKLGMSMEDAKNVLEGLRHKGDLAADATKETYHRRKS